MCLRLGIPRSSFYAWRARVDVVTASAARRKNLGDKIKLIFADRLQVYGCRRIAANLNAAGTPCSLGLVASLMREMGLVAIQPRAWKRTTTQRDCTHEIPDLIGRDFAHDTGLPGERLVGDILCRCRHNMSPTSLAAGAGEPKSRRPFSSTIWLPVWAVLALGFWVLVALTAVTRLAWIPSSRIKESTVALHTRWSCSLRSSSPIWPVQVPRGLHGTPLTPVQGAESAERP